MRGCSVHSRASGSASLLEGGIGRHGQRIKSKLLLTFGGLAVGPSARMIIELNIKHYGRLLKVEADPARRQTITKLFAEEREKPATLLKQEEKGR